MDIINREDRIGQYLRPHLGGFLFDELSESYLERTGLSDIMSNVPIPVRKTSTGSISPLDIAKNMAFVIGCDPGFKYRDSYVAYILRSFDKNFARGLLAEGVESAQKNDYDYSCIMFRAAMIIDPENVDAVYCYGRACKDSYEQGEEEDFVARFKAESIEAFEEVTIRKPDFAESYYFLGYGYINLGLYVKAKLTWEEFLKLSKDEEKNREIEERLSTLKEPVEIEEGYNLILAGKYAKGSEILLKYTEGRFADWWPLWYYLGIAYGGSGMGKEAIDCFLKVLKLSPSNRDAMEELVKLYEAEGDAEKAEKYKKKIKIVAENREKDRLEAMPSKNKNLS